MAFEFLFGRAVLRFVADDRDLQASLKRIDSQTKRSVKRASSNIAKGAGQIGAASVGATAGIAATSKGLTQAGAKARELGTSFGVLGTRLGALGAVGGPAGIAVAVGFGIATLAIVKTTKAAADFEAAFAEVRTLIDESKIATDDIRKALLELPPVLGTAQELTKALYQAISAGAEPAAAIELVATAAKLARAGLTSVFAAVDILTTAINAYGFAATEAARLSDILFKTVELGKTTVDALSRSLGVVIPFAAQLGISFEDLNAAVATLTKGGLDTRIAITALRGTFIGFIKQADKFRDAGIDILKVISEEGLIGAFRSLREATGGNIEAIKEFIPDARALTAVLALTGVQFEEFVRIQGLVSSSAGATERAFQKQINTFRVRSEELANTFERLKITIGTTLLPALTALVKGLSNFIERVGLAREAIKGFAQTVSENTPGIVKKLLEILFPLESFVALAKAAGLVFVGPVKKGAEDAAKAVGGISGEVEKLQARSKELATERKRIDRERLTAIRLQQTEEAKPSPLLQQIRDSAEERRGILLEQNRLATERTVVELAEAKKRLAAAKIVNRDELQLAVEKLEKLLAATGDNIDKRLKLEEERTGKLAELRAAEIAILSEGLDVERQAAKKIDEERIEREKKRVEQIKKSREKLQIDILRGARGANLMLLQFEAELLEGKKTSTLKRLELEREAFNEGLRLAQQDFDLRRALGMASVEEEIAFNQRIVDSANATADQQIEAAKRVAQLEDDLRNRQRTAAIKLIELAGKRAEAEGRTGIDLADILAEGTLRQKEAAEKAGGFLGDLRMGAKLASKDIVASLKGLTEAEGLAEFAKDLGGFPAIIGGAFEIPDVDTDPLIGTFSETFTVIEGKTKEFGARFRAILESETQQAGSTIRRKILDTVVRALEQEGLQGAGR